MHGNKNYKGKGYGKDACNLILDYGFNVKNLNSIWLRTYEYNTQGRNLFEKIGFKLIGTMREARIIGEKKYDVIFMDILSREYKSVYVDKIFEKMK